MSARTRSSSWSLLLIGVLAACSGPPERASTVRERSASDDSGGGEAETVATGVSTDTETRRIEAVPAAEVTSAPASSDMSSAYESVVVQPPNLTTPPPREPAPLALIGYAFVPDRATRVLLATLELPPGERFVPPISSCQDVLVYLVEGTLDASGTGIGSVDAPATLYPGDAVRFGPEGDGLVVNTSGEAVRTVVAIARQEDAGPARLAPEERSDRLVCSVRHDDDPLVVPARLASYETTAASRTPSGLDVRVLLDADAAGAEHAGLAVLVGSPETGVSEHVHDAAAEVLYVEDGDGVLEVGERHVDVHPGVSVYVPAGTPHSFVPSGQRSLRVIQFYAPSGPEQRFRGTTP